jgi:ABC-type Fe3+-hydroxamate transport system substrate-binding protein
MVVTDACGSKTENFNPAPKRIVSVVPSQTELLYHLGLNEEVIGITKFCVHPNEWFRSKTRVGGTKTLNLDKIRELQPDLILANKEENEKDQIEALAAEFPVWVTDVTNLEEALQMIATIGVLTGKTEAATLLKKAIAQKFEALAQELPMIPLQVCYLIWKDPYITVGGDTFIHNMLLHAGFKNIFAAEKRYPTVTIEMLEKQDCDVLLLSSEPYPFAEKHIRELQPQLPNTKIILVDGEMFSWYGSRLQWTPAYFKQIQRQLQKPQ